MVEADFTARWLVTYPEATEDQLLQLWRVLSTEARQRITMAIVEEIGDPKGPPTDPREERPKKRGLRAKAHVKTRQLAREFDAYKEMRGGRGSVEKLWLGFVKTFRGDLLKLLPKGSTKHPGGQDRSYQGHPQPTHIGARTQPTAPRASPPCRGVEGGYRLVVKGSHPTRSARAAIRAGRAGRRGDAAKLEALARAQEFYLDRAKSALLGDEAVDAFIRMPPGR